MGEHDERDVVIEVLVQGVAVDGLDDDLATGAAGHAVNDVEVGVEVDCVGDHDVALRLHLEGPADDLGQQEGERVGDEHIVLTRPDEGRHATPGVQG